MQIVEVTNKYLETKPNQTTKREEKEKMKARAYNRNSRNRRRRILNGINTFCALMLTAICIGTFGYIFIVGLNELLIRVGY